MKLSLRLSIGFALSLALPSASVLADGHFSGFGNSATGGSWGSGSAGFSENGGTNKASIAENAARFAAPLTEEQMRSATIVKNILPPPKFLGVAEDNSDFIGQKGAKFRNRIIIESDDNRIGENKAFGTHGMPYTTTRVQRGGTSVFATAGNVDSTTFPYRAVGKLWYNTGGGTSFCSASVIRSGIIVTAAHCVQQFGSGSNIFGGFTFRPGHYGPPGAGPSQVAPYGTWTWRVLVRSGTWAAGNDPGCGAARDNDIALIALNRNGANQLIGQVTGYFGYGWNNYSFVSSTHTGNTTMAATTTLGYPGLMDGGNIMQRADGPSRALTLNCGGGVITKQISQGSNFTGGSSGGPWTVNFLTRPAALSGGAVPGTAPVLAVVGVTSWGAADPNAPKDNWSSQFSRNSVWPNAAYGPYGSGNIGGLLNQLCNYTPSGSAQTLAQQGYCN